MNSRDRKRHEERKARKRAAGAGRIPEWAHEPELRGTGMDVLPLDDGAQVRRLIVDATDPLPVVVRWCRRALLTAAPPRCVRVLAVRNWDDDRRELLEIPEARAYFRRLWHEARPLLRLLSESTWAPLPDDTLGLPGQVLSGFGMGWLDVYVAGFCELLEHSPVTTEHGPAVRVELAGMSEEKRAELRAELLEATDDNPGGLSFDAVAARTHFIEAHVPAITKAVEQLVRDGEPDSVVLVCSTLDEVGRELAVRLAGNEAVRAHLQRCQADDLHAGVCITAPRPATAELVAGFAPQAAGMLEAPAAAGSVWVLAIVEGGTQVARFPLPEHATL